MPDFVRVVGEDGVTQVRLSSVISIVEMRDPQQSYSSSLKCGGYLKCRNFDRYFTNVPEVVGAAEKAGFAHIHTPNGEAQQLLNVDHVIMIRRLSDEEKYYLANPIQGSRRFPQYNVGGEVWLADDSRRLLTAGKAADLVGAARTAGFLEVELDDRSKCLVNPHHIEEHQPIAEAVRAEAVSMPGRSPLAAALSRRDEKAAAADSGITGHITVAGRTFDVRNYAQLAARLQPSVAFPGVE